jgi:hypothetical protein
MTAASTAVAEQNKYYLANIGKVKSINDLVYNYQLFSYAMTAFSLGSMTYARGLMTKGSPTRYGEQHGARPYA